MHQIASFISQYGYVALAVLVLAEDLGLPVPGETAVLAAGAAAHAGQLQPIAVWLIAATAAIIGDNGAYAIGKYGGRPLLERWGRFVRIGPTELDRAGDFLARWGGPGIFIARFILLARVVAGLVAGATEMPWRTFLSWQVAGAFVWAGVVTAAGYAGYTPLHRLYDLLKVHPVARLALGTVVIGALAVMGIRLLARWDRRSAS